LSSKPKKRASRAKKAEQKVEGAVKAIEKEAAKAEKAIKKEIKPESGHRAKQAVRPSGHAPKAMVFSRHGTGMISRRGRGFSHGELTGAGVESRMAARWGLRVDPNRRSVLEENVSSLKQWSAKPTMVSTVRKDAKAVEERAEEVVKEAEVDVEVIEAEAKKVEKGLKKEAKKVEGSAKKAGKKPRKKKESA
jgi:ribosomal protein L13E